MGPIVWVPLTIFGGSFKTPEGSQFWTPKDHSFGPQGSQFWTRKVGSLCWQKNGFFEIDQQENKYTRMMALLLVLARTHKIHLDTYIWVFPKIGVGPPNHPICS